MSNVSGEDKELNWVKLQACHSERSEESHIFIILKKYPVLGSSTGFYLYVFSISTNGFVPRGY